MVLNRQVAPVAVTGHCAECGLQIEHEASVVGQLRFHPACFRCDACKEPLGAEPYFVIKGKNYCGQCRDVRLSHNVHTVDSVYEYCNVVLY